MNFLLFFLKILIFVFGLSIGSFLGCLVYRLRVGKNLMGRSLCPYCNHELSFLDLIPVLSFLILGGRCRYCRKKISIQYLLIELATALLFLEAFNYYQFIDQNFSQFFFFSFLNFLFSLYFLSLLVFIFFYDFNYYLIPDKVLLPAIIVTFLFRMLNTEGSLSFLNYFFSALIFSLFFLFIFLFSKGNWIGFGDVKFIFLIGLFLGFPKILASLFIAFSLGSIIGILGIILGKKTWKSKIALGPFLVIGVIASLFWGEELLKIFSL